MASNSIHADDADRLGLLQAIPSPSNGLRPDTTVSALPRDRTGRVLLVGALIPDGHKHGRLSTVVQRIAGIVEKALRPALRAPVVTRSGHPRAPDRPGPDAPSAAWQSRVK